MALKGEKLAERVKALARLELNGGNVSKTARELGMRRSTLQSWIKRNEPAAKRIKERRQQELDRRRAERDEKQEEIIAEEVDKVVTLTKEGVEELAVELRDSLVGDLRQMKLKKRGRKPPFKDRMIGFGITFDKLQLMGGNPTAINKNIGTLSDEERASRASELLESARQRRVNAGGQPMGIVGGNHAASGSDGQ
jgi:transposase